MISKCSGIGSIKSKGIVSIKKQEYKGRESEVCFKKKIRHNTEAHLLLY
jgi:hypothetical protein